MKKIQNITRITGNKLPLWNGTAHRLVTDHVHAFCQPTLQEQPNLRTRLDDTFLLRFLRARKFDYDRALQLLLNYHAGRKAWPEVFQDLKPSTVKHVLDLGFLTVLPQPDPNGRYILCLRPGECHCSYRQFYNVLNMILLLYYSKYILSALHLATDSSSSSTQLDLLLQENGNQMIIPLLTMWGPFIWLWRSWSSQRKRRWMVLLSWPTTPEWACLKHPIQARSSPKRLWASFRWEI